MKPSRIARHTVLVAAVLALTLAGCGRRGPLEAPRGAAPAPTASPTVIGPASAGAPTDPAPAEDDSFVLDPLI